MSSFKTNAVRNSSLDMTTASQRASKHGTKTGVHDGEKGVELPHYSGEEETADAGSVEVVQDTTHRRLKPRHIQLIGIGVRFIPQERRD